MLLTEANDSDLIEHMTYDFLQHILCISLNEQSTNDCSPNPSQKSSCGHHRILVTLQFLEAWTFIIEIFVNYIRTGRFLDIQRVKRFLQTKCFTQLIFHFKFFCPKTPFFGNYSYNVMPFIFILTIGWHVLSINSCAQLLIFTFFSNLLSRLHDLNFYVNINFYINYSKGIPFFGKVIMYTIKTG